MQGATWTLGYRLEGKGDGIRTVSLSRGSGLGEALDIASFLPRDGSSFWGAAAGTRKEKLQGRGGSVELYRGVHRRTAEERSECEAIGRGCKAVWGWQGRAKGMQLQQGTGARYGKDCKAIAGLGEEGERRSIGEAAQRIVCRAIQNVQVRSMVEVRHGGWTTGCTAIRQTGRATEGSKMLHSYVHGGWERKA